MTHKSFNLTKIMMVLCSMIFLSVLNGTIFNVALPFISQQFSLTPSEVSWVVVGYGTIFAIGSVTYGKLADIYPLRYLLTIGLSLFSLGSMVGFLGNSYAVVIAGRLIQASGAAAIPALAMIVSTRYFPPEKRGKALGFVASTVAFGSGLGPIVGGFMTQYLGWRYLFLLSLLSLVALPLVNTYLPKEDIRKGTFDITGGLLLATGVALALLGINLNSYYFMASFLAFYLFIRHVQGVHSPFVQLNLLQNKVYRSLLLLGFLVFFSVMSSFFVLPLMLKEVNGLPANIIGITLFPGPLTAALLGSVAGNLSDKHGSVIVIQGSLALMFFGFLSIAIFVGSVPFIIALFMVFFYVGFSSIQASLGSFISKTLQPGEMGVGMGLYNLTAFMGGAFGPALAGRFLELNIPAHWNPLNQVPQSAYSNSFVLLAMLAVFNLLLITYISKKLVGNLQTSAQ